MRTSCTQAARLLVLAFLLLSGKVHAESVTLTWDPSGDAATPGKVAGYNLYIAPGNFTLGSVTNLSIIPLPIEASSYVFTNVLPGHIYYFAVVAVDPLGAESPFSNLAVFAGPSLPTPSLPTPSLPAPNLPIPGSGGSTTSGTTGSTTTGSSFPVASVALAWDAVPESIGYKVFYGLQNFAAPGLAGSPDLSVIVLNVGPLTNTVIPNLLPGLTYYIAVVSVSVAGTDSDFSNVIAYTVPPVSGGGSTTGGSSTGSSTSTGSSSGSTSGGTTGGPSTGTQINLLGMLPRLWLYPTNGQALLALQGTVGASFWIQYSTNPAVADSWITITNLKLTLPAPNANPAPGTTLEKAFIPALEAFQDPNPVDGTIRYYRIYMPHGYPVLADQVLTQQGFDTRLVAVRCPGLSGYIVCYVTEEAAYLDYNDATYIVRLEVSGPTIREVATKVANTLQQNWTSASEFTVDEDGNKLLFATVVKTDDPLSDPPLGVPRTGAGDIVIDF